MTEVTNLNSRVRSGLAWSALNNATLRLGTLLTGILLARILDPESFGLFAIALTVQTVLMSVSELGMSADLVRRGRFAERGPTIATLSLVTSSALTAAVWINASRIAGFLGNRDAAPAVQVMALTLLLAGLAVVPYARLQRELRQRDLFRIELVAFVVATSLSVGLAVAGWGAMAIALGRLGAMVAVVVLEYVVTASRPTFGWNQRVAVSALRFGVPLSFAGLLAVTLLSIDNALVGRLQGATILGLYALAFNVSSWPSSVLGTAIRAVAMPAFAHHSESRGSQVEEAVVRASALTWSAAVPIATALGVLSGPIIGILYGAKWSAAASVLTWLAALGAVRILTDVWVAYLTAAGRSGLLLTCQAVWLATLAPAMWWAVRWRGLEGAGGAHVAVGVGVAVPIFLVALRRTGVNPGALVRPLILPVLAAVPAAAVGLLVLDSVSSQWMQLFAGGLAIAVVYAALVGRWVMELVPRDSIDERRPAAAGARRLGQ